MNPGRWLDPRLREALARIIAADPGRPDKWYTFELYRLEGFRMSRQSVNRFRRKGVVERSGRPYLTPTERDWLLALVVEAGPDGNRSEVARALSELAGRPISARTVDRLACKLYGPAPSRRRGPSVAPVAGVEARSLREHERKLSRHRPDRTPRAGHVGRVVMDQKKEHRP